MLLLFGEDWWTTASIFSGHCWRLWLLFYRSIIFRQPLLFVKYWHSCLLMDLSGPSIDMRSRVHQKTWGFWVHQKTWGFRRGKISETWVFWVHQKTWGFKRGRVHQKTWGFWVHQKTWGFMRGNTKMGSSKHMRFLGPSKDMRFQEGKQNDNNSTWEIVWTHWGCVA